jgi:hypothetical protein
MNKKGFLLLLLTVIIIGGSIGGAFSGGLAMGRLQEDSDREEQGFSRDGARQWPDGGMQRGVREGRPGPEQAWDNRPGRPGSPEPMGPKNIINGTIIDADGTQFIVQWGGNESQIELSDNTTIQVLGTSDAKDISEGDRIVARVTGGPIRGAGVDAASIIVNPPEIDGFPGHLLPRGEPRGGPRGPLTGMVMKSSNDQIIVETRSGKIEVNFDKDIVVQTYRTGTAEDLSSGDRVLIISSMGNRERGLGISTSIIVNPPGHDNWGDRP